MDRMAMLIDASKCMACRGCQVACKQWNDLEGWSYSKTTNRGSYENPQRLSPQTWTRIKFIEYEGPEGFQWLFLKEGCMHCGQAACVEVCPTGALKYGPLGIVTFQRELCNGCGYCSQFCPFHIPQLEVANKLTGQAKSSKCTFCQDRTTNELTPACVKTCPAAALSWGDRNEMIAKGRERVAVLQTKRGFPNANLYGETELGGLGRLYVLTERPANYGLPEHPASPVLSRLWQDLIQPLAQASFGVGVLVSVAAFFIARRNIRMEQVE